MKIKIKKIASHRNGIRGNGFYVVLFTSKEKGDKLRNMVAIVFPESGDVAVLDVDETQAGNIEFANGNSWRGDEFEPTLRKAIEDYENGRKAENENH